jgi:hypothetical protein
LGIVACGDENYHFLETFKVVWKIGVFGEWWYVISMVSDFEIFNHSVYGLIRRKCGAA